MSFVLKENFILKILFGVQNKTRDLKIFIFIYIYSKKLEKHFAWVSRTFPEYKWLLTTKHVRVVYKNGLAYPFCYFCFC